MSRYALEHLSDATLLRGLAALVARDRVTTAEILAHIAEVDARKLYLEASYPSMFAYCVGELHLCEQAAFKRIVAARATRRFPLLFEAVAEGRLHLSGLVLLAPHLTAENAKGLLEAATHRSKADIGRLLAERFPRPDLLAWVEPAGVPEGTQGHDVVEQLSPGKVDRPGSRVPVRSPSVGTVPERSTVKPLAAQAYALQCTLSQRGHDDLRRAQELLGRQVAVGDVAQVIERGLALLVAHLQKTKFAATTRPHRSPPRPMRSARHIPAHVKRAVWERDEGRCSFVSETGKRCPARRGLEFDHVEPFSRGGEATVSGIRLLCTAHNQYMAERAFGAEFMHHKRLAAAERREATRNGHAPARRRADLAAHDDPPAAGQPAAAAHPAELDVVPWLRALGFSAAQARHAAERCGDMPDATLEARVKAALSCLRPRGTRTVPSSS